MRGSHVTQACLNSLCIRSGPWTPDPSASTLQKLRLWAYMAHPAMTFIFKASGWGFFKRTMETMETGTVLPSWGLTIRERETELSRHFLICSVQAQTFSFFPGKKRPLFFFFPVTSLLAICICYWVSRRLSQQRADSVHAQVDTHSLVLLTMEGNSPFSP